MVSNPAGAHGTDLPQSIRSCKTDKAKYAVDISSELHWVRNLTFFPLGSNYAADNIIYFGYILMGLSLHLSVWQVNATLTSMMTFKSIFNMLCHYLARANRNILDYWKIETSVYAYIPSDTLSVDLNHVYGPKDQLI